MGLASALTTSLTGLSAAEAKIDVVGNNLANAQTVGFKESSVIFATQFLQTYSLGSAPAETSGGTNPRQVGLGVQVAEIKPDFTQGTIEISGSSSNLAIQGDGFFIVQGSTGEELYTRSGIFKTNANNELVTSTGNRLLGYGVDTDFTLQETELVSLRIPLGEAAVAQPTSEVIIEGTLTPTADVATTAEVIQSAILGDGSQPQADSSGSSAGPASTPSASGVVVAHTDGGGTHTEGSVFQYKFVYVDSAGTESGPSSAVTVTIPAGDTAANNTITLNNLPAATGDYTNVRIYRTANGGSDFYLLDEVAAGSNYIDDNSTALSTTELNDTLLTGNYSYVVTYFASGYPETRPSQIMGPVNIENGRIQINNLPTPPVPGPGDDFPAYTEVRIYRNLRTDSSSYYLVGTADAGESFTDNKTDAEISNLSTVGNKALDADGPKIGTGTYLIDVVRRDGFTFENVFEEGTLTFAHKKGGRTLGEKTFEITDTTTVQDLIDFMEDATGVFGPGEDGLNPIPASENHIVGETGDLTPGGSIVNGAIRFVSNNGKSNALSLGLSAFSLETVDGEQKTPNLSFSTIQEAEGDGAVADFLAYDSLGIPVNVRITTVLEEVNGTSTVYRWFAESPDNDPATGARIAVGTGRITFDGEGNFVSSSNSTVSIERRNVPSTTPLEFDLNFEKMSGLAADRPTMSVSRQDGSRAGTLTSYIVGEDGIIRGVFNNGTTKTLGQIRMAKFANPAGLEARGQSMFANGVNAGISYSNPGADGAGKLVAGAVELSNVNIGRNLVDLVLASTLYRGNSRVISTAQELLDELMNLRR